MLALKYLLMILGVGLFGSAGSLVFYDIYISEQLRRLLARNKTSEAGMETATAVRRPLGPVRWRLAQRLAISGVLPILLALSIVVIPDGTAGVRVSQIWGARRGTLYPGVHFVTSLVDSVTLYDTREQVYSTVASAPASAATKSESEVLVVQAREGLNIGLAVSVRYRLDPRRLDAIHSNLPQPVGEEVVAPVVSTIYRQLAPNYVTQEIFATKREELRFKAAAADAERMKFEASVLKQNPMLIQKIIAERLSDKLQIMMVPMDGKNFFANDVMHSAFAGVTNGNANAAAEDASDAEGTAPAPTVSAQKRSPKKP